LYPIPQLCFRNGRRIICGGKTGWLLGLLSFFLLFDWRSLPTGNERRRGMLAKKLSMSLIIVVVFLFIGQSAMADRTYTTSADFDDGELVEVNHDIPDQLQLNSTETPFAFVNVAASARGTIVRINADTGEIMGEYRTAPNGRLRNPSRTSVDSKGNVWTANRDEDLPTAVGGEPSGTP
jgi:hypothetical protein